MYDVRKAQPIHREEDGELLGYVLEEESLWLPLTIFGYALQAPTSHNAARELIKDKGLDSLMATWQYFDKDEGAWFNASIIEATKDTLTLRITDYGHPNVLNSFTLHRPTSSDIRLR